MRRHRLPTILFTGGRFSLQAKTLALVMVVGLLLVGLDAANLWFERSGDIEHSRNNTINLAQSVAQHGEDTVRAVDGVLTGLVERLERDGTDAAVLDRLRPVFRAAMAVLPQLDGITAADAEGTLIVTSQPTTPKVNVADRDYFQFHQAHVDPTPYLGTPVRSRVTGNWIIPVSRRFNRPDGTFAGVLLATITTQYFQSFYAKFEIGTEGSIVLAANDGTLLVRRPFEDTLVGKRTLAQAAQLDAQRKPLPTNGIATSRIDGILRLFVREPVQTYPLYVFATAGMDEVLADWHTDLRRHLFGGLLLAVLIALFSRRLITQANLQKRSEQDLARSEARYRLLAEYSSDMISVADAATGQRLYASPSARQLYGYDPEELVGKPVNSLVHPEDLQAVETAMSTVAQAEHVRLTHRVVRKDGTDMWVEANIGRVLLGDPLAMLVHVGLLGEI